MSCLFENQERKHNPRDHIEAGCFQLHEHLRVMVACNQANDERGVRNSIACMRTLLDYMERNSNERRRDRAIDSVVNASLDRMRGGT